MSNLQATATTERDIEASPPPAIRGGCDTSDGSPPMWRPPLDPAPVLAAHNKLTVLLMNAVEKQANEATDARGAEEDQEWVMDQRNARWWDVRDALEELVELVEHRA